MESLKEAIKTIESFRELKHDWNGNNAEPLSEKVINKALNLAKELKPIPLVFPTANNSIQFEWEDNILYLEMEIFEDCIKIYNHCEGECGEITSE
jgi:hypothetical protein